MSRQDGCWAARLRGSKQTSARRFKACWVRVRVTAPPPPPHLQQAAQLGGGLQQAKDVDYVLGSALAAHLRAAAGGRCTWRWEAGGSAVDRSRLQLVAVFACAAHAAMRSQATHLHARHRGLQEERQQREVERQVGQHVRLPLRTVAALIRRGFARDAQGQLP